jgi:hypothetical protein
MDRLPEEVAKVREIESADMEFIDSQEFSLTAYEQRKGYGSRG